MIVITDTNIFYRALAAPYGEIAKILSERKNVRKIFSNRQDFF